MKVWFFPSNTVSMTNGYQFNFLNTALLFILFGAASLAISPSATAQKTPQLKQHLPPPPPLSPRSRIITGNRITRGRSNNMSLPTNVEPPTSHIVKEYTFSVPGESEQSSAVTTINNVAGYRVEVLGSGDRLLEQVRVIEPRAFSKGEIIQVGIFSEQDNAANLVRKLALQGLWARIVAK